MNPRDWPGWAMGGDLADALTYYDRPTHGPLHGATRAELEETVRDLTARQARPVQVPTRTHHHIDLMPNLVTSFAMACIVFSIAAFGGAPMISAIITGVYVGLYVLGRNLLHNRRGEQRITMTRARAEALAYLDDMPDEEVSAAVTALRETKAEERRQLIDDAQRAYRAHAVSPIAALDPDSWNARRRELAKALNDLGVGVADDA